jgi:hypothetical protein
MILAASRLGKNAFLPTQNLKKLFKFHAHLLDYLLTLRDIRLRIVTRQALTSATDGETLIIEEASDLSNDQNVLTLIIAAVTPSLHRF